MATPAPVATLKFAAARPEPVGLIVIHLPNSTVITREWAAGDSARCRLCPSCGATPGGTCTVVAPGRVDESLAAGHALVRPT